MSTLEHDANALPVKYADLFKRDVQKAQTLKTGGGMSLKFKQGQMLLGETSIGQGPLYAFVLAYKRVNKFYLAPYGTQTTMDAPDCYAIFDEDVENNAQPSSRCTVKQCDFCQNCPKNVFGTAANGKGKACQNVWRLVMIPMGAWQGQNFAHFSAEAIMAQSFITCSLPVTSGKNFAKYVKTCASRDGRPSYAYGTAIKTQPHPKNQFEVVFEQTHLVDIADETMLDNLINRAIEAEAEAGREFTRAQQQVAAQPAPGPVANSVRF